MGIGRADYLDLGNWNAVCYSCGFKFKASELIRYWQGYYLCKTCWNPRQPQDFVRSIPDVQTPPWTQPRSVSYEYFCSPTDQTCYAGTAVAGCAMAGFVSPMFIFPLP